MKHLIIDIETRSNPELDTPELWAERMSAVQAPANYKDPVKIANYISEEQIKMRDRMALNAYHGLIACIGIGSIFNAHEPVVLHGDDISLASEKDLLARTGAVLKDLAGKSQLAIVGYNVRDFDLPFIYGRLMANEINWPTNIMPKPRDYRRVIDLYGLLGAGRLDDWMQTCGLGKKKVAGKDLLTLSLPDLIEHCAADVTAECIIANRLWWLLAEENQ